MFAKVLKFVKENQDKIVRASLIVGGALAGILVGAVLKATSDHEEIVEATGGSETEVMP